MRTALLFFVALQSACATTAGDALWPRQPDASEVLRMYDGPPRLVAELAIVHINSPVAIRKMIRPTLGFTEEPHYYRGAYAVLPGLQNLNLSYFVWRGRTRHVSKPFTVQFDAKSGRVFATFYAEGMERIRLGARPSTFVVRVLDVTDDAAIESILKTEPYAMIRAQALEFTENPRLIKQAALDKDPIVQSAASQKTAKGDAPIARPAVGSGE